MAATKLKAPYFPIIYVRGYAMSRGEIDDTTADPFCGFNLGSTVFRAVPDKEKKPRKYIFESPVVRLGSDFGYSDVYEDGYDIGDPEWEKADNKLSSRSIIIYRYYDPASSLLGESTTPSIESFAEGLGNLIARVCELVCKNKDNAATPDTFRCYLVAHSMGGLVCRAFLQNTDLDPNNMGRYVDKFFTYATPHNGIDLGPINVPSWLSLFDVDNFNRDKRMPRYLGIETAAKQYHRVDLLPEDRFPPSRVFCMVGTNRIDYEAASGLSRTFVGHGSDGLVKIANATLTALNADGSIGAECAKAFAFRAHSGYFGIVNSEEAFQNLWRFLFGDVRVDLWMDIEDIRLPSAIQKQADDGREVNALYQIEVLASPRGKLWYLTRRAAEEDSVACVTQAEWKNTPSQYLSSVFLANRAKVNKKRRTLAYSMTVGVRVPDYEVERVLWPDEHYEGGYLFRDSIILEMTPPKSAEEKWRVKYAWQNRGVASADEPIEVADIQDGKGQVTINFESTTTGSDGKQKPTVPGIKGKLRFVLSAWNTEANWEESDDASTNPSTI